MENCYCSIKLFFLITFLPLSLSCECTISSTISHTGEVVALKLLAIASILVAGASGILIPILGRKIALLRPESNGFFVIKAFAAGVILATALVHILPNAFDRLTSPCIGRKPWHEFPIAGFVAMGSALVTMTIDSFVTGYYRRLQINSRALPVDNDEVAEVETAHGTRGHAHGMTLAKAARDSVEESMAERIRHRVISQVLELGIVVHSVIIGVSLGTSKRSSTIRPLLGALSFHQFFEGIGLGGCIIQAKFKARATVIMAIFFSLTTPTGIGLGIAISSRYNENSSTALSVEGIFDAASSGILIYMALVDLLAADFMSERMQSSVRLQLGAHLALLLGAGFMSILAIWA